ncbi:hypothetical protein [Candidatus Westeberhardia cardiocondylae]|uniref:hypothetical protein n=1 Tax=Candidatus Westeberhardia cardiocondylae TaxID=1594731 RepID=UPI002481F3BE|nr:hypothetical protein [Candidatus Westeberhardia cardiocondylae]
MRHRTPIRHQINIAIVGNYKKLGLELPFQQIKFVTKNTKLEKSPGNNHTK